MLPLEGQIGRIIDKQALIAPGETVVVGVSGGSDSMALLHLLAVLAEKGRFTVRAVYVDHGLRPAETPQETALVRSRAAGLGIGCEVVVADVRGRARAEGISLEHAGRLSRYEIFADQAAVHSPWKIAVAHTADDQAEELLLRLIRGTGRKGLSGMAMASEQGVIRPLLEIRKKELLDYLAAKNIPFLEDSSNVDRRFMRNRVRLDLLPYLEKQFNPNIRATLIQTGAILSEEEGVLAEMTAKAFAEIIRRGEGTGNGSVPLQVDIPRLVKEPMAIQRRVIERLLWRLGAQPSFRQIDQLLRLADAGGSGDMLHLAQGLRVVRQEDSLILSYPQGRIRQRGSLLESVVGEFELVLDQPGAIVISELGVRLSCIELGRLPTQSELAKSGNEFLDLAAVRFPLICRSPRPGDRLHPLGAPGTKKVADIFIDRKIPRNKRSGPVLLSGGEIVAVLGLAIAESAKITPATQKVLKVFLGPL